MSISNKCRIVLSKDVEKEICGDPAEIRRWVICMAWKKVYEKKMPFGEAMSEAWKEIKNKCRVV